MHDTPIKEVLPHTRGPQRDKNPVQGVEEVQEIQLKIANEKSVGTGLGTCKVDVELCRRRGT